MPNPEEKKPQRALIPYRVKPLATDAKWEPWREREIDSATDSEDAMSQFFDRRTWPAMTGAIEVKQVIWLGADGLKVKAETA